MSTPNGELAHVPDQLVEQLLKGYDALSIEIKLLDEQRRQLENKVSWAKQQYLDALKRFSPENASPDFRTFLDELDEASACQTEGDLPWLESILISTDEDRKSRAYNIQTAADAREKIRYRQKLSDTNSGVRIWNGPCADVPDGIELEKDFTTAGTPGRLKCPFVPPGNKLNADKPPSTSGHRTVATPRSSTSRTSHSGRRSKRSSFHDPIRAEMCGNDRPTSRAPSIEGSVPLCPIRFLNEHSPEEVARYFEKHKHELPRSHEICVKRYQSNEASIRQLDAKYGSLVSMIQGLGQKHQPMLPEVPDDEAVIEDGAEEPNSKDKVQNWATAVSVSLHDEVEEANEVAIEDEDRESHFDRHLKDVRVGESPTRPWGIPVPVRYETKSGISAANSDPTASPLETPQLQEAKQPPKAKCPFDHQNTQPSAEAPKEQEPAPEPPTQQQQQQPPQPSATQPHATQALPKPAQMVFTGPVFIGFGMDQALALLQQSGIGGNKP